MRKIYTGIELGSYSIKIVVCEIINNNFVCLASSNTRCKGIKNGIIVDSEAVKEYLVAGIRQVEEMLGFPIKEAIVGITSFEKTFDILTGEVKIDNPQKIVRDEEIQKAYQDLVLGKIEGNEELLSIMPISFQVDEGELTKDPKGLVGDNLSLKGVIVKVPKQNLKPYLSLFKECGIIVTDMTLSSLGDYYEVKNTTFDSGVSAIINIGYDKIDVSIYNKGIMIKYDIVEEGSKSIDKDIAYMYKIKRGQARKLKENFGMANPKYASCDDTMEIVNRDGEEITVNAVEVSEVIEARLIYLFNLAKKQITLLTNREISNIIITGGISELAGFNSVVEREFDHRTSVLDIRNMGVRNNMYSSTLGLIKYFYNKINFRGINYSMIKDEDSEKLSKDRNRDSILDKVFGYFKDE